MGRGEGRIEMVGSTGDPPEYMSSVGMPDSVKVLTTRNMVLFPGVIAPIVIGRGKSMLITTRAEKSHEAVAVVCQKDSGVDDPGPDDLYSEGVYAQVLKVLEMPNGVKTAIVQALSHLRVKSFTGVTPYLTALVEGVDERGPSDGDREFSAAFDDLREKVGRYIKASEEIANEALLTLDGMKSESLQINFLCTNMPFTSKEKVGLLGLTDVRDRLFELLKYVNRELELQALRIGIQEKTRDDLDKQQRNYFIQQQIRNLQAEMGGDGQSPEVRRIVEKSEGLIWPSEAKSLFDQELEKLGMLNPQSPEYSTEIGWLQTVVSLPWGKRSKDNLAIEKVRKSLDRDHYGMDKVKERILEYIAVLGLRCDLKSPILCFYGPPGVGKTSLAGSIAKALGRSYVRVSLGGVHDESEIRGHRRTYIGAMPGRIIKGMLKAGTRNPVFVLDEIDKVGENGINGDPSSALLEVLDPEQNNAFHDNYLDMDYDLSDVMFIATANDLGTIPRPLLDRMELIEVSGYSTEEKGEIARRHLVPKELEATGLKSVKKITFSKASIEYIVERYTRESGVRQLEKQINKALRRIALGIRSGETSSIPLKITPSEIGRLLGKEPFYRDIYQGNSYAGVVTGLAWTSVGGEILFIETSLSKGKGSKLTLTGNLGDVMKESAILALEYVKAHASVLGIDYRIFESWNIHVHVPEGATPKDGPSAGITIATSIASALTQRKVRQQTAMTGEITLRGRVLPVGGIKEKILAAKRAGIVHIVMSSDNRKDVEEISAKYRQGLEFHYVERVSEVWDFALTDELVDNPARFDVEEEKKEP